MSSVLQRKIESGTGLPPSVVCMQSFWDGIRGVVSKWATKGLDAEFAVSVDRFRSVGTLTSSEPDTRQIQFALTTAEMPTVRCLCLDLLLARQFAARRLRQDVDQLNEVSLVFLKLMIGDWSNILYRKIEDQISRALGEVEDHTEVHTDHRSTSSDAAARYIQCDFNLVSSSQSTQLSIIFDLNTLMQRIETSRMRCKATEDFTSRNEALKSSVRMSPVVVEAVLYEMEMTIGSCARLNIGDVLVLGQADRKRVNLTAQTLIGRSTLVAGEMGGWQSNRAIRLTEPVREKFLRDISNG